MLGYPEISPLPPQVMESKKQLEAVEEKKPEPKTDPKTEPKPVNKSRPVARIAIPGTVWSLVRTSDGRCFFYDPSKHHSVWKRPEELKNRPDVDKLLSHKPEVTTEDKEEKDMQEEPPSKKMKSETEVTEVRKDNKNEFSQQIVVRKEGAIKVEAQVAQQRSVVSMEVRRKRFKELLAEKNISAHARWEKELHKIASDKRYLLLTSRERRQVFEEYVKDRAEKEDNEKNQKINEQKGLCRQLFEEDNLNEKVELSKEPTSLQSGHSHTRSIPSFNSQRSASFGDIRTKGEQNQRPYSSSLKEKLESWQNHIEEVIADFKQFLAEKVTHSEDSYICFKSLSYTNPIWKEAVPLIDTEKLYNSHVVEVHKKNRAILWPILDGIDVSSLFRGWDTVKKKVQVDPRFHNYTDREMKCKKEYVVYVQKKFLKAKEDFKELLKETKLITPGIKTKLKQGIITLKDIECLIQNDKRYTALVCIPEGRKHMLQEYIDGLK